MNSGIYTITNKESGKSYIGSTNNFGGRWRGHRRTLCLGTHYNKYLQRAWNKYGEQEFEFGILEYLDNFEELSSAEQFWVDIYREEGRKLYNIGECVDCPWRGQDFTEEHRHNLSKALTGRKLSEEHISRIFANGGGMLGREHTEESKRQMSKSHEGYKHTEEAKQRMSESHKGLKHSKETRRKQSKATKMYYEKKRAMGVA